MNIWQIKCKILSIFDANVQELIKQHAHNKKYVERMNGMFRLLFA